MVKYSDHIRGALLAVGLSAVMLLSACSSSDGEQAAAEPGYTAQGDPTDSTVSALANSPTTRKDAARLLQQGSFGPNEKELTETAQMGAFKWLDHQFKQPVSRYSYTLDGNKYRESIHNTQRTDFCSQFSGTEHRLCWQEWFSHVPLQRDFFRQAVSNSDQLRQRVALTLSQIFVVSARELRGTYGLSLYQQMLRDNAFSNVRTLLEAISRSPVMGEYLNNVNNEGIDPNENYARELLQLFSIGTCELEADGSIKGDSCQATYDNEMVRNYSFALSGWTYPEGGLNPYCTDNCKTWTNPKFHRGDMVAIAGQHDQQERQLLSGVSAPAGRDAEQGLQAVLDSIMAHPNVGPFLGRQLIQFLVTSNPSPAYVARVSAAYESGRYSSVDGTAGSGQKGDMKAMIAAVLLDSEARDPAAAAQANFGRLREPVLMITGSIRALNGVTDGAVLGEYGWARKMGQSVFGSPSVFNFYSPMQPLAGTDLVAPRFGIDNANTNLARINFANALVYWWYKAGAGLAPDPNVPFATGTKVNYEHIETVIEAADDSEAAIQVLNEMLVDGRLSAAEIQVIAAAMDEWQPKEDQWLTRADQNSNYKRERVRTAVYLILSSPQYQVQR
jgi:uncharacterized protein (DUF1800 family)